MTDPPNDPPKVSVNLEEHRSVLTTISNILAMFVAAVTILAVVLVVWDQRQDRAQFEAALAEASQERDVLEAALDAANRSLADVQTQLDAAQRTATSNELDRDLHDAQKDCEDRYRRQVERTEALLGFYFAKTFLNETPDPAAFRAAVDQLEVTTMAQDAYVADGRPLPCPLD